MIEWVLVLYAATNMMSNTDSVALTNIPGFTSPKECETAGRQAAAMSDNTYKTIKFVCIKKGAK